MTAHFDGALEAAAAEGQRIADENLVEYVKLVDWHAPPVYGPRSVPLAA